jgi:hypothetical protein
MLRYSHFINEVFDVMQSPFFQEMWLSMVSARAGNVCWSAALEMLRYLFFRVKTHVFTMWLD